MVLKTSFVPAEKVTALFELLEAITVVRVNVVAVPSKVP
jgi:hypothetical protein